MRRQRNVCNYVHDAEIWKDWTTDREAIHRSTYGIRTWLKDLSKQMEKASKELDYDTIQSSIVAICHLKVTLFQ